MLQQCHLSCIRLPEEEHNGTSHRPTNDSAYGSNTPGSLRSGTTKLHASPMPQSPTECLDLQCPNCGISDFYSPRYNTCGNQECDTEPCSVAPLPVHIPETGLPAATNYWSAHLHPFLEPHMTMETQEGALLSGQVPTMVPLLLTNTPPESSMQVSPPHERQRVLLSLSPHSPPQHRQSPINQGTRIRVLQ